VLGAPVLAVQNESPRFCWPNKFRPDKRGREPFLALIYFTDLMNDDQPYLIQTEHGPIVSVPYTVEMNDFMIFLRRGMTTSQAVEVFKEQFDVLYAEGAESGRLMNLGLHPHVIGKPFRVRAVREFIQYANRFDGVWWATREEIAEWYLKNHRSHIG
jgi:allantoinase